MKILPRTSQSGIALIIVMVSILVLAVLAGGFAYSMKVETRLARNVMSESEMEWLGRSGVELARYVLGQQMNIPGEPYDALNQIWAGGPGGPGTSNSPLAEVSLSDVELGRGKFSVKIVDQERKLNVNIVDDIILQQGVLINMMGMDPQDASTVSDSILDWRDEDNMSRMSGWESAEYLSQPQAYSAKNGPLDDVSELLLIHGVTPAMYFGGSESVAPSIFYRDNGLPNRQQVTSYPIGMKDIFCVVGGPRININTASASVLQCIPGLDASLAQAIVTARAGEDGADGTADDIPFANVGEVVVNVPGMSRDMANLLNRYCNVRSSTFEAQVDVTIDQYKRRFIALLRRNSAQDIQILNVHWE